MKLKKEELLTKLKELGAVSDKNEPLMFPAFKNRCAVHKYGKNLKIVFMGIPGQNLFGFYVMYDTDMSAMKEAYGMYLRLVKGDMTDYVDKDLQWGLRIPISYGNMRQI
jgi:hypothetical protein